MTNLLSAALVVLRVFVETNLVEFPRPPGTESNLFYITPVPCVVTNYVIGIRLDGTNTLELLAAQKRGPWVVLMGESLTTTNMTLTNRIFVPLP